jgi:hypothetical protein
MLGCKRSVVTDADDYGCVDVASRGNKRGYRTDSGGQQPRSVCGAGSIVCGIDRDGVYRRCKRERRAHGDHELAVWTEWRDTG